MAGIPPFTIEVRDHQGVLRFVGAVSDHSPDDMLSIDRQLGRPARLTARVTEMVSLLSEGAAGDGEQG